MAGQVVVEGADRLASTLRRAADQLGDLRDVNAAAGAGVRSAGAGRAPRRTGRLASSLRTKPEKDQVTVESNLVYAGVIHWGWPRRNIRPQPFLSTALESNQPQVEARYAAEVDRIIGRIEGA